MNVICRLFLTLCNMSVTAAFVIGLVLLGRCLLKKAPRRFAYYLWIIVAFRLICPYSFSSVFSIFNLSVFQGCVTGTQAMWTGQEERLKLLTENLAQDAGAAGKKETAGNEGMPDNWTEPRDTAGEPEDGKTDFEMWSMDGDGGYEDDGYEEDGQTGRFREKISLLEFLTIIWLLGIAVLLGSQAYAFGRLRRRVAFAVRVEENVYECENIQIPFVMGFLRPIIYLPLGITENERVCILLHEQCHIRRHDHQVKLLAVLLLAVYWFHLLVWLAYYLMCKDMEMSCDERVVQMAGSKVKEDYSRALLSLAARNTKQGRFHAGYAAFGDTSVKIRIRNILNFRAPGKRALIMGAALCILFVSAGLGNGRQEGSGIRCVKRPGNGDVEYEYKLDGNIRSFLIYKEYYLEDELLSYEVIRAEDLSEAGVKKAGKLIISPERRLDDGITFRHKFEGDESFAGDHNGTFLNGGYLGMYQGIMEDYYLDNNTQWKTVEAEQDLALAAWHVIDDEQGEIRQMSCEQFMDPLTKQQVLGQNAGEILYYLVFSEKNVRELEEEYAVCPYAGVLYEAKNPNIGDVSADEALIESLGVFPGMKRTIELETKEEPYVLRICYEDRPSDELSFYTQMVKKAVTLLCLIDNAGRIEWTYPAEKESGQTERRFCCTKEQASAMLGTGKPGRFAESRKNIQELLIEYIPGIGQSYDADMIEFDFGTDGYASPEGRVYPHLIYMVGRLPGEEYDTVLQILSDEAEVTAEDVAGALADGGVSQKLYVVWDDKGAEK